MELQGYSSKQPKRISYLFFVPKLSPTELSLYSVYLDDIHQISNLTPEHQHILSWVPLAKNIIYFVEPTCRMWF
jgi:hypothetical protein